MRAEHQRLMYCALGHRGCYLPRRLQVDVMIESKAKEMALLRYREAALHGKKAELPAAGAAAAAVPAAEDDD